MTIFWGYNDEPKPVPESSRDLYIKANNLLCQSKIDWDTVAPLLRQAEAREREERQEHEATIAAARSCCSDLQALFAGYGAIGLLCYGVTLALPWRAVAIWAACAIAFYLLLVQAAVPEPGQDEDDNPSLWGFDEGA
jgi:hypothetical protein